MSGDNRSRGPSAAACAGPIALSVIIPTRDSGPNLSRCLKAVASSDVEDGIEIIVVDDHSRDGSVGNVPEDRCTLVRLEDDRYGPAAARNRGEEAARGDLLLFLDSDVVVAPDTLRKFVETFREEPEIDAVFGSYSAETECRAFFSQYKNLQHHYTHQTSSEAASTFWTGCGAIRRAAFREAGGFDESYSRPCIEDIALGYTLFEKGRRIRLRKDIQVRHLKSYTFGALLRSDLFGRAVPWTRLMLERRIFRNDLNTRANGVLSVAVSYAALASLLAGLWMPAGLWATAALVACFLALNRDYLAFIRRRKGLSFTGRAAAMTFLYNLYSGLGLGIGLVGHVRGQMKGSDR